MKKQIGVLAAAAATSTLLFCGQAWADFKLNMPVGVTTTSREVYSLHMFVFWVCVVIGVLVYGLMIYAIVSFRKSKGATAATFSHNRKLEVVWTTIPAVILILLAIPSARTLVEINDTRNPDLTVKITGYQWRWQYDYIDDNVRFYSTLDRKSNAARRPGSGIDPNTVENYLLDVDRPLVVPVNAKVRLLVTAADVIHSWWVPAFAVKRDAVPGYINEAWFKATEEGTFRGQCAELCGMDHGFMPIVVRVVSKDEYQRWLAEQQAPALTRAQ
ncbi:MAG TPA: cytochrome c oxidase subunit II [Gammaproteobacteria bacterium]|nr:cytochrome c oxidase subunit II [Gammaproteobacteria bacterium]